MRRLCRTRKQNLGNELRQRGGFLDVPREAPARRAPISVVRSLKRSRANEPQSGTSNINRR
jgi:hypothetical protein